MNVIVLLLLSISFPAQVFSVISDGDAKQLLKLTEKQIILNNLYEEYVKGSFTALEKEAQHSSSDPLVPELSPATFEQVLAGLIDQYEVVQLNVISLACALYYEKGDETSNRAKAAECHKSGKLLSRYNEMLTAEMFIDAYKLEFSPERLLQNHVVKLDTLNFARKIDVVKHNLKLLNTMFTQYESHYSVILKNIGMMDPNSEKLICNKGAEFFHTLWLKLWQTLGTEYIDVTNYARSFLGLSNTVQTIEQLRSNMNYVEGIWEHILDMTDINDNAYLVALQEIILLKKRSFTTRMLIEGIPIPENLGKATWDISPTNDPGSYSDYVMELLAPSDLESQ